MEVPYEVTRAALLAFDSRFSASSSPSAERLGRGWAGMSHGGASAPRCRSAGGRGTRPPRQVSPAVSTSLVVVDIDAALPSDPAGGGGGEEQWTERRRAGEQRRYNRRSPVSDVSPPYYEVFDRIASALERLEMLVGERTIRLEEPASRARAGRVGAESRVPPARGSSRGDV